MRLIDAEKFEKAQFERCNRSLPYVGTCSCDNSPLWKEIESAPTVDAEPVRHAKWIYLYESSDINRCSLCDFLVQDKLSNVREMFKYCPNCGAKMDDEVSDG